MLGRSFGIGFGYIGVSIEFDGQDGRVLAGDCIVGRPVMAGRQGGQFRAKGTRNQFLGVHVTG